MEGPNPTSLHFSVGSRDNTEAIVAKLESSRALAVEPPQDPEEPEPEPEPVVEEPPKKPSVHFSNNSPVIIPPRPSEPSDDEPETEAQGSAGVALYDFTAAGDDELSVKEGEQLTIVEMDEEDWWKCRNAKNQEGMVPSSYLEVRCYSLLTLKQSQQTISSPQRVVQHHRLRVLQNRSLMKMMIQRLVKQRGAPLLKLLPLPLPPRRLRHVPSAKKKRRKKRHESELG